MRYSVLIALVAVGCGGQRYGPDASPKAPGGKGESVGMAAVDDSASMVVADAGETSLPNEGTLLRKIIYTAEVDLVVESFDPVPAQVGGLAKRFGGYVASSNVTGAPGSPRTGQWTLRIPVDRYEDFLASARELGEVQCIGVDSEDVSEEYYDVEARLRNKRKAEERLLTLLEDASGKLDDILAVERELSRVREEIERVEGRLRVLEDLTSLTTVQLSVREVRDYVPEESATYMTRVRRGWESSISTLVSTSQGLSIALVVLLPWLPGLVLLCAVLVLLGRLLRRRRRS